MWNLRPREVQSLVPCPWLLSASLPIRSLPSTFFLPTLCSLSPHLRFSERQAVQRRARASGGSWQTARRHPKGNSSSSGAEPEAISGLCKLLQARAQPWESVGRGEEGSGLGPPSGEQSLVTLSIPLRLVCGSTSELSHSRDGAGITLRGEKNPLHGDRSL